MLDSESLSSRYQQRKSFRTIYSADLKSMKRVIDSRPRQQPIALSKCASLRKSPSISLDSGCNDRYTARASVSRGVDFVPYDCLKNARSESLLFLAFLPTWKIDVRKFWRAAICQIPRFSQSGGQRFSPILFPSSFSFLPISISSTFA